MKKLTVFIFTILTLCFAAKGQEKPETTYYNKDWVKTSVQNASFYRISTKENELFKISYYYINGTPQMVGFVRSDSPDIKEGLYKYYNENGGPSSLGVYVSDKKNAQWKYYDSTGNISAIISYS